ncbi:glutamate-cysteine ligase family protein [Streptomyces sp. ISL-94]|uniref:glutamate-cysteine ligase family protein n=1 Tax=Streptomyces sp. ISL-94 TaxID=2819190 RepID=UPI001BEB2D5A|nr:glutamate-cysteine ligase family protein [Streptomyces sp. ISL-94]MBT2478857.1 hypothetical protein [Streptomyces sp. ISL-94]
MGVTGPGEFGRWPTAGPAPLLDNDSYEDTADALVASGILMDRRMIYWFARPSEHHPTVEFRVADTTPTSPLAREPARAGRPGLRSWRGRCLVGP